VPANQAKVQESEKSIEISLRWQLAQRLGVIFVIWKRMCWLLGKVQES